MLDDFQKLNKSRTEEFRKSDKEESFLQGINQVLEKKERQEYQEYDVDYPFIFVIGLPRSGTTLLTQIIAHGLKISYINNVTARFWGAPLHGLKLSDTLIGKNRTPEFKSKYGSTESLSDIHEFGYFWRKWLNKSGFDSIINAKKYENDINWNALKAVLTNMQAYTESAFIFKNIYGSYHISKLDELLKKTLWIYIERDPLDVAISNLNARIKFYGNPNTWWSYVPPEYEKVEGLDAYPQIAGQLHYLKKFYYEELNKLSNNNNNGMVVKYENICSKPADFLDTVQQKIYHLYGYELRKTQEVPDYFPTNRYTDQTQLKSKFESLFKAFQKNDPIPKLR